MNNDICPSCGQFILVKNELTELNLPNRPRKLLFFLYHNRGHYFTRDQLAVATGSKATTIPVHINKIRRVMSVAHSMWWVHTSKEGYMLRRFSDVRDSPSEHTETVRP